MIGAYRISPAILARSPDYFRRLYRRALTLTTDIHVDIMDGTMTRSRSIGPTTLAQASLPSTAAIHLMVKRPERWLDAIISSGARQAIIHAELGRTGKIVRRSFERRGLTVGIALTMSTPSTRLRTWAPCHWLHLMLGPIGRYGSSMDPAAMTRVSSIRRHFPRARISCDVGLNDQTIPRAVQAGADVVVVGSAIWGQNDPVRAWARLERQRMKM